MYDIMLSPVEMLKLPQQECPVYHHFGENIYIREVHMPAGTFAIGHKQKYKHNNFLLKGSLLIVTDSGEVVKLQAPLFFVGEPGQKKGFVLEDVIWQNIYSTSETNIDELEKTFLEKEDVYLEHVKFEFLLDEAEKEVDREDYRLLLKELNITEEQVQRDIETLPYCDQLKSPTLRIAKSTIHGVGVFTTAFIPKNSVIGVAHTGTARTSLGRYINHKTDPNCEYVVVGEQVHLVAKEDISGCLGGAVGTELSVNYREALFLQKQIKE